MGSASKKRAQERANQLRPNQNNISEPSLTVPTTTPISPQHIPAAITTAQHQSTQTTGSEPIAVQLTPKQQAEIWEKAFREGFQEGFKMGAAKRKELTTKYEGQLEEMRRESKQDWWNFENALLNEREVGKEEGIAEEYERSTAQQAENHAMILQVPTTESSTQTESPQTSTRSIQASPPPTSSLPPLSPQLISTSEIALQTEPLIDSNTTIANSTSSLTPIPVPPSKFNWAEDAAPLPIHSQPSYTPRRDLSCLRSENPAPFSNIRRRNQRQHHFHPRNHRPHYKSTRLHHSNNFYQPLRLSTPTTLLNWDQDPHLFELSRALRALGWIRG